MDLMELRNFSLSLNTSLGRTLIMADPHLGFELSRGLRIRTRFEETLSEFILLEDPDLVIILGDLKEPLGLSFEMKSILNCFFEKIRDFNVVITKGNHDGRLEEVTQKFPGVKIVDHFLLDGLLFLHGHKQLPGVEFSEGYLGHVHPAYTFKGATAKKIKVFVRIGKFLIFPTINPFLEGLDIRSGIKLVPFLREAKDADLFLPEGIHIGRVEL
ncbi:metallophosphoesterase [Thermococcus waiotapuensis]|uniref:Metallophosphoesterase n=1 Tax=Thermococcus waiotapuensis TaxID=90909 RepID=A0AAE4NY37_9EURY|nr:metallophosphoesterase [Thermococcus waiotapuensis]MDV3104431.1 metallophosphoesterase [Thermococcus waiotapuensis]